MALNRTKPSGGGDPVHKLVVSEPLTWCFVCAGYAESAPLLLTRPCTGKPRQDRRNARRRQLLDLRAGRHPETKIKLLPPVQLSRWKRQHERETTAVRTCGSSDLGVAHRLLTPVAAPAILDDGTAFTQAFLNRGRKEGSDSSTTATDRIRKRLASCDTNCAAKKANSGGGGSTKRNDGLSAAAGDSINGDSLSCSAAVGLTGGSPLSGGIDAQLSRVTEGSGADHASPAAVSRPHPSNSEPCMKKPKLDRALSVMSKDFPEQASTDGTSSRGQPSTKTLAHEQQDGKVSGGSCVSDGATGSLVPGSRMREPSRDLHRICNGLELKTDLRPCLSGTGTGSGGGLAISRSPLSKSGQVLAGSASLDQGSSKLIYGRLVDDDLDNAAKQDERQSERREQHLERSSGVTSEDAGPSCGTATVLPSWPQPLPADPPSDPCAHLPVPPSRGEPMLASNWSPPIIGEGP